MRILDDSGRVFEQEAPQRLVSLVPSLTELVCDLGLASHLVGCTRFCTHPAERVKGLRQVGGTKDPDISAIVEIRPDAVLMNSEENRREDFERLSAAGLSIYVSNPPTIAALPGSLERLCRALGAPGRADPLAREIRAALELPHPRNRPRVFCPIWRNPWMSINRETFSGDLLCVAGGGNVCEGADDRFPVVTLEEIAAADPEVLLLPDEPYVFSARHIATMNTLCNTSAWRSGRVHLIDGKGLSWYGARTPRALRTYRALLGDAG